MAEIQSTIEQVTRLPELVKRWTMTAGQSIKDDPDVLAIATKVVPAGKVADVIVRIQVKSLRDINTDTTEFLGEPNE